jgi:hypothetical protein
MPMQYVCIEEAELCCSEDGEIARCGPRDHFGTLNSALPCPVHAVVTVFETEEVSKRAVEASL